MEHGAAIRVGANGFASGGKIGPRRKKGGPNWERNPCFTEREQKRKCEASAGGISGNNYVSWQISFTEETAIGGNCIVDRGWKLIFWRETIVRRKDAKALKRETYSDGAM